MTAVDASKLEGVHLRSILCPVDFSDPSRQALRWAIALACRFGSRLTVLNAVDPLLAEAARARLHFDLAARETEPELRRFVAALVPAGAPWAPEIGVEVRVGQPAEVIVEAVGHGRADLVVMGTQGLGGVSKLILGSTAERVLRRAGVPVLAVPPHALDSVAVDATGARLDVRRVLAATDFSDTARAALEWAIATAAALEVPLTFVHAVEPLMVPPQWRDYASDSEEPRLAAARERLEALAVALSADGSPESVVSLGRPAEAIASTADESASDLIVVGLMGDQGHFARRPGSIAYRLLGLAKVPVVVVPPPAA